MKSEKNINTDRSVSSKKSSEGVVSEESQIQNLTKQEVIENCDRIFFNFASYYREEDKYTLSTVSIIKILKAVNLLDDNFLKRSDVDIMIKKLSSTGRLNNKQFLEFLVLACQRIDSQEFKANPRIAMNLLLGNFLIPFAKYIEEEQNEENSDSAIVFKTLEYLFTNYECDFKLVAMLNNIYPALKEIYINYFHYEINNYKDLKKIEHGSQNAFNKFCKEFEIIPYLISNKQMVSYFKKVIKLDPRKLTNNHSNPDLIEAKKDLGVVLTLSKLCLSLIHFAVMSYNKQVQNNLSTITDAEKLLLFLERLETSQGYINLEKLSHKPQTAKITLIPSKDVIRMINGDLLKTFHLDDSLDSSRKFDIKEMNERNKGGEEVSLRSIMSISDDVFDTINSRLHILKDIFLEYSRYGDKINIGKLSLSSYMKFLKDFGIVAEVSKELRETYYKANTVSRCPLSKSNMTDEHKNINSTFKKTIKAIVNSTKGETLSESDVNILYYSLTGPKNFVDPVKIKQQFDKNSGYTSCFNETNHTYINDKSNLIKTSKMNTILKMDFNLFMKSFELVAQRLYPQEKLNKAVVEFFKKVYSFNL
jgi:hypothetical protein